MRGEGNVCRNEYFEAIERTCGIRPAGSYCRAHPRERGYWEIASYNHLLQRNGDQTRIA